MKIILIILMTHSFLNANLAEIYLDTFSKTFLKTMLPKQHKEMESKKVQSIENNKLFFNKRFNDLFLNNKKLKLLLIRENLKIRCFYNNAGMYYILNSSDKGLLRLKNFKFTSKLRNIKQPLDVAIWNFSAEDQMIKIMFNKNVAHSYSIKENEIIVNNIINEIFERYAKIFIKKYENNLYEESLINQNINSYK